MADSGNDPKAKTTQNRTTIQARRTRSADKRRGTTGYTVKDVKAETGIAVEHVKQEQQPNNESSVQTNINMDTTVKDVKAETEIAVEKIKQQPNGSSGVNSMGQEQQPNNESSVETNINMDTIVKDVKAETEIAVEKIKQQPNGSSVVNSMGQEQQPNNESYVETNINMDTTDKDDKAETVIAVEHVKQQPNGTSGANSMGQEHQSNDESSVETNINMDRTVTVDAHISEHTDGIDTGSTKKDHLLTEDNSAEATHVEASVSQSQIAIGDVKEILDAVKDVKAETEIAVEKIKQQPSGSSGVNSMDQEQQPNNESSVETNINVDTTQIAQLQDQHSRDMRAQEDKFIMIQQGALKTAKDELRQEIFQQINNLQEQHSRDIHALGDMFNVIQHEAEELKIEKDQLRLEFDEQSNEIKKLQNKCVKMATAINNLSNYVQQQLASQLANVEVISSQQSSDVQQLQKDTAEILETRLRQQSHDTEEKLERKFAEMIKRGENMGDQGPAAQHNKQIGVDIMKKLHETDAELEEIKKKLQETDTELKHLTQYGEYMIKTEDDKINDKIKKMENKHRQQLGRQSNRIIKCEEEHTCIKDAVNQLVQEIADIQRKHDAMMTDIDGRMQDMRNEMVDGDQLQQFIMNKFYGKLEEYDVNQNEKLDSCIRQLETRCYGYVDQKNTEMQKTISRLDHNKDYDFNTLKENTEEELHKIRENYNYLSCKVNDLKKSVTESHEEQIRKRQQQFTETEKMIVDLEGKMVGNVETKLKELKFIIVNGDLLDNSKLNETYKTCFSNIDGRLKFMESKQCTLDAQLIRMPKLHRELLDQELKKLEQTLCQRDVDVSNDGNAKLDALRADINCQLTVAKSNMESLNTSLHLAGAKIQIIETIQNRAPVGFTARATGYQISTRYPIMKGFSEVTCNDGGYYNTLNGIFTAPIAGVYVVNLTHTQSDDGEIFLNVVQGHRFTDLKTLVAYTWTYGKHSTSSDSAVVKMQEGDSLYVKVQHYSGNGQIWSPSSFSCFLLR